MQHHADVMNSRSYTQAMIERLSHIGVQIWPHHAKEWELEEPCGDWMSLMLLRLICFMLIVQRNLHSEVQPVLADKAETFLSFG